jgi:hypothetical protein
MRIRKRVSLKERKGWDEDKGFHVEREREREREREKGWRDYYFFL